MDREPDDHLPVGTVHRAAFGPPPNPPTRLECSAIEDGLANTYTIARKDSGYRLRVSVSASNAGVKSEPAESNDSEPVGLHLRPQMSAFAAVMPRRLPRDGQASAILRLGFTSGASNSTATPRLSSLSFELSRNIELHTAGLSRCPIRALYAPAAVARRKCAAAIVGHGIVRSELFFGHEYEPVTGKLTAYYFSEAGKPGSSPGYRPKARPLSCMSFPSLSIAHMGHSPHNSRFRNEPHPRHRAPPRIQLSLRI